MESLYCLKESKLTLTQTANTEMQTAASQTHSDQMAYWIAYSKMLHLYTHISPACTPASTWQLSVFAGTSLCVRSGASEKP